MTRILMTVAATTLALAMSGAAYAGEKSSHSQPQRDMHANSRSRFDDHDRYDHDRYDHNRYDHNRYWEPGYGEPVCSELCQCQPTFSETCECGPFCNEFPWRYRPDRYGHNRRDHEREHPLTLNGHSRGK